MKRVLAVLCAVAVVTGFFAWIALRSAHKGSRIPRTAEVSIISRTAFCRDTPLSELPRSYFLDTDANLYVLKEDGLFCGGRCIVRNASLAAPTESGIAYLNSGGKLYLRENGAEKQLADGICSFCFDGKDIVVLSREHCAVGIPGEATLFSIEQIKDSSAEPNWYDVGLLASDKWIVLSYMLESFVYNRETQEMIRIPYSFDSHDVAMLFGDSLLMLGRKASNEGGVLIDLSSLQTKPLCLDLELSMAYTSAAAVPLADGVILLSVRTVSADKGKRVESGTYRVQLDTGEKTEQNDAFVACFYIDGELVMGVLPLWEEPFSIPIS